jgi:hypothetical protein
MCDPLHRDGSSSRPIARGASVRVDASQSEESRRIALSRKRNAVGARVVAAALVPSFVSHQSPAATEVAAHPLRTPAQAVRSLRRLS